MTPDQSAALKSQRELKRLAKLIVSNAEAQKREIHQRYVRAQDKRNGRPRP